MVEGAAPEEGTPKATWVPSRKWFVNIVTLLAGVATSWVTTGWDQAETLSLIGITVAGLTSYLVPNAEKS